MRGVTELFKKFQSSDGRIKALTATGILAIAALVALAIGVLPALATHVAPVQVNWGGGSGACFNSLTPLAGGAARGPSSATYELHIQNPKDGQTYTDPATGLQVQLKVHPGDTKIDYKLKNLGAMAVRDIIINGGKKSNHSDYDAVGLYLREDTGLMAPEKDNQPGVFHRVSHINICYDLQPTFFECGGEAEPAILTSEGLGVTFNFTEVTASIFTSGDADCVGEKVGFFFKDNTETASNAPDVLLAFGDDGFVAGRMDITKQYTNPANFADLRYYHVDNSINAVPVSWCGLRDKDTDPPEVDGDGVDGDQFDLLVPSGKFPDASGATVLSDGNVACKVAVFEYASGIQETVLYILFKDPRFY